MAQHDAFRRRNPLSHLRELFEASALGLVTLLLLGASFFATWRGMGDFVAGNDMAAGAASKGLILLVVVTLTLAMYVALREMIAPYYMRGWWSAVWKRCVAGILYLVLASWSVGFGYGFWWSLIAGQDATETALSRTMDSLNVTTNQLRAELAAGAALMDTAEALSEEKAARERSTGGTCGIASQPGAGPLNRAREETRSQIAALSASVRTDWLEPVNTRLEGYNRLGEIRAREDETAEARKTRMIETGRLISLMGGDIAADATARGRILAEQLRPKAAQLSVEPVSGAVEYCYDRDLAVSLMSVADALDGPFEVSVIEFRFAEGADGVAQAVEDLWLGVFGMLRQVFGPVDGRDNRGLHLDGRSLIALIAAIGVDLALFVFALLRGSPAGRHGRGGPAPAIDGGVAIEGEVDEAARLAAPEQKRISPSSSMAGKPGRTSVTERPVEADGIPDAEYIEHAPVEDPAFGLTPSTFVPDSQLSDEEQLTELLNAARMHQNEIHTAGSKVSETRARNRLNDVLRRLRKIGYESAGADDVEYKPDLHQIIGQEVSDLPPGQIVRIERPRFMGPGGRVLIPALVIVSKRP